MPISVSCPECHAQNAATVNRIGDTTVCSKCSVLFRSAELPEEDEVVSQIDFSRSTTNRPKARRGDSSAETNRRSADIDVFDEPPSHAHSETSHPIAGWLHGKAREYLVKLLLFVALLPLIGAYQLYNDFTTQWPNMTDAPPRSLTVQKLLSDGAKDGEGVELSDFKVKLDEVVVITPLIRRSKVKQAYLPLLPAENEIAPQVFLRSEQVKSRKEVEALTQQQRFRGSVHRGMKHLETSETEKILHQFPDSQLDQCYFVMHDELPPTTKEVYMRTALWIVLILLFIPYWLIWQANPKSDEREGEDIEAA